RDHRYRNPEKRAEYLTNWREQNREVIRAKNRERYYKNRLQRSKQRYERKKAIRNAMIELLGGKCVKCGFSDIRALQIDHVNGGGTIERRKFNNNHHNMLLKYLENVEMAKQKLQLL